MTAACADAGCAASTASISPARSGTPDLDLVVGPAEVLQLRRRRSSGPGPRCGTSAPGGPNGSATNRSAVSPGRPQIAAGQLSSPATYSSPGDTRRHRPQPVVQHVDAGVAQRTADRHRARRSSGDGSAIGRVHGGLGGAVHVDERHAGQAARLSTHEPARSAPHRRAPAARARRSGSSGLGEQRGHGGRDGAQHDPCRRRLRRRPRLRGPAPASSTRSTRPPAAAARTARTPRRRS